MDEVVASVPEPVHAAVLPLRFLGDPVLRKAAKPVTAVTAEIRALAAAMVETMYVNRGVGLAAPQVGRSLRLVVLDTRGPRNSLPSNPSPGEILLCPRMPLVLVNPEIVSFSKELDTASEGCLSVTKIYADVTRPAAVVLRATLLDGQMFEVECGGLLGRCVQHELDHLDGVLFPDRISDAEKETIAADLAALEKRTRASLKRARGGGA